MGDKRLLLAEFHFQRPRNSPIFANIYLHELDKFVVNLAKNFDKPKEKKFTPEYLAYSLLWVISVFSSLSSIFSVPAINSDNWRLIRAQSSLFPFKTLLRCTDLEIISAYNAELRGLCNYYSIASNFGKLNYFAYLMEYSCLKTLAGKHKSKISKIKAQYKDGRGGWGIITPFYKTFFYESAYGSFHRPLTFCAVWQS